MRVATRVDLNTVVVRLEDLPKNGEEQTEKDSSLVHKTFDLIFVGVKIQDDDFNEVFFFCLAPRVSDVLSAFHRIFNPV